MNYTPEDGFIQIQDLKISKYEGILPKVYRTALNIGDNSLYKIMKQGVNYYKPIVSKMYEESSSTTFFIRSKNLNLPIDLKDKTKYKKDKHPFYNKHKYYYLIKLIFLYQILLIKLMFLQKLFIII